MEEIVISLTKTLVYPGDIPVYMPGVDYYRLKDPLNVPFSVQTLMDASARKSVQQNPPRILSTYGTKYDPEALRYEDLSDAEKGVSVAQFAQDFKNRYPNEVRVKIYVDLIIDRR